MTISLLGYYTMSASTVTSVTSLLKDQSAITFGAEQSKRSEIPIYLFIF
jgi:hypothetical protein